MNKHNIKSCSNIVLLSFIGSLATKCLSLNNELCLARPTLTDLNPNELHYYPFMVSLDICSGYWSTLDNLSSRIFVFCISGRCKFKCL